MPVLLFPNGDLDLAGEKGEATANGEVDPANASNPVRLVAVLGVTGCGIGDDPNAANDDRLNGDAKGALRGVVSGGNGTFFVDGEAVGFGLLGEALEKMFCPLTDANGDAAEAYDMNPP